VAQKGYPVFGGVAFLVVATARSNSRCGVAILNIAI